MTPYFEERFPIVCSTPLWNKLTNSVCYFIAKDMQPYDTVNHKGFQHLLHTFQPHYQLRDRKTLATHYIPQMYDSQVTSVQQKLSQAKYFAITTDMWMS